MTKEEVLKLMASSKDKDEWNLNCEKVKAACGGYPKYWYIEVIKSGLCDRTLGNGSSSIIIRFG